MRDQSQQASGKVEAQFGAVLVLLATVPLGSATLTLQVSVEVKWLAGARDFRHAWRVSIEVNMLTSLLVLSLHAEPTLTVVAKNRVTLEVAAVEKLGLQKADWKEKGVAHVVEGVPLEKVLAVAGWGVDVSDGGVKNKHGSWRQVLLAKATDGYSAVFSSGEVSPSLGATRVLVVTRQDGAALSGKLGRFRLVVLSDLEPARSLFSLESLELKDP